MMFLMVCRFLLFPHGATSAALLKTVVAFEASTTSDGSVLPCLWANTKFCAGSFAPMLIT
jgi:hypothetical protein